MNISRRSLLAAAGFYFAPGEIRNAGEAEQLADGSSGTPSEFRNADGVYLPAYVRRPRGAGPFPVVMIIHGGAASKGTTYGLGRSTDPPAGYFVAAGWAVMTIDFRPAVPGVSRDREDAMAAIEALRRLPFIDARRLALLGGSHGANVVSGLASRVDARCGVLCAPAVLDPIEIAKAIQRGEEVVGVLKKIVANNEKKYGVPLSEVAKDPAKYGYQSAFTEAPEVRFPILIVNGRKDTSSPLSVVQAYTARLSACGKEVETHFADNGPHGFYFGNQGVTSETEEAAKRAVAFIRKHFEKA